METIIENLEQYRKRNGFEHTKYATREDSNGDLRAITLTCRAGLENSLLFSLVIATMVTFSIIILLREIKITDLNRFLFEKLRS